MITLFVGDNDQSLGDRAREHDTEAFLVDRSNWKKITSLRNTKDITIYTSLSDLPKIDKNTFALWKLIQASGIIYYCPSLQWSDDTRSFSWAGQKILTEYYLILAEKNGKTVVGLDRTKYKNSPYLTLEAKRNNDLKSLWVSGCSISHGVGVDISERYGSIIGRTLSIPTYHLTKGGSSIEWAADQILRSDIHPSDILIWGITQEKRAPLARQGIINAWPDDTIEDVDYRLHETRYYKAITSVFQVINFCEKIKCDLILLPLICSEKLQMDLIHQSAFYLTPYQQEFLDLGTDGIHPGPKQHQFWSDFCLDIIKKK